LAILSREPRVKVLGVLAAVSLEDLIEYDSLKFIQRIETESRHNPAIRDLLFEPGKVVRVKLGGNEAAAAAVRNMLPQPTCIRPLEQIVSCARCWAIRRR
jgi:hypothetical protein